MKQIRKQGAGGIVRIVIDVLLLVVFVLALARYIGYGKLLQSQLAGERYSGRERYVQVSCYYPAGSGITLQELEQFRMGMRESLEEQSHSPQGESVTAEVGEHFTDAYSVKWKTSVRGVKGSVNAAVLGVGGDYFTFHPLRLRSGSYISESDLMHDRVVLDEELAWQLFGGIDVAGMEVEIGNRPYVIAGVVEREKDFASMAAYKDGAGMYMYYEMMPEEIREKISCYEILLPNRYTGYGKGLMEASIFKTQGAEIIENTGRFGVIQILGVLGAYGSRSMQIGGKDYPYWENAARVVEDNMALMLVVVLLLGMILSVQGLVIGVIWIRGRGIKVRWLLERPEAIREAVRRKRWKRKGNG